jgi:hypothetical protein
VYGLFPECRDPRWVNGPPVNTASFEKYSEKHYVHSNGAPARESLISTHHTGRTDARDLAKFAKVATIDQTK